MKYVLVSLDVIISGLKFRKEDNPSLDDAVISKKELKKAYKSGFIKPIGTKANNPAEVKAQFLAENDKPVFDKCEFPDDIPGREALIKSGILTFDKLKEIDDYSIIKGIGASTSKQLKEWIENK